MTGPPSGAAQTPRRRWPRCLPLRMIAVGSARPVAGADETLADANGHLRERYGVPTSGAAYLLRPDQHVCARWMSLDATRLRAALINAAGLKKKA